MTKRKSIIFLFIAAALSFLASAYVFFGGSAKHVTAAEEDFEMLGASLRYTADSTEEGDDGTGIRFEIKASEELISTAEEIGFVIVPSKYIKDGAELTVYTDKAVKNPKTAEDWNDIDGETGYKRASVYVYGIPDMDKDTEVKAVGYAKVDGAVRYTQTVERSMKYIAVAASCDNDQTNEVRAAVARYTDNGNVTYWGDAELTKLTGSTVTAYSTWSVSGKGSSELWGRQADVEEIAITTNTNGWWVIYNVNTPAIKDISNYKYLSFKIRATHADSVMVSINETARFTAGNEWERVVFTKNEEGVFTSQYGNLFAVDNSGAPASATNMNGIRVVFGGNACGDENGMTRVYFADMYVSNELPQLEYSLPEYKFMGEKQTLAVTAKEAEGAEIDLAVSVNGSAYTDLTVNSEYSFAEAGEHKFMIALSKDGKILSREYKSVYCVKSNGNEVIYSGDKFGVKINGLAGWQQGGVSYEENAQIPGETQKGALKVTRVYDGAATAFSANNASITNVSAYKYVYFDVYNPQSRDVDFTISWVYGYPVIKLLAEKWTRVTLLVRGGSVYMINAYTDQNGGTNTQVGLTNCNFGDVQFAAIGLNVGEYFLMGNVYAVNEFPFAPDGIYDYNAGQLITAHPQALAESSTDFVSSNLEVKSGTEVNRSDLSRIIVMVGSGNNHAGMRVNTPNIKDVSSYRYIYVDVYCEECDFNFMLNYQWGSPYVTVKKGEWKRIVLKNDGNGDFVMPDKSGNLGGGDTSKVFNGYDGEYASNLQLTDISGVILFATTDAAYRHVVIGAFAVCNELPALPAGVTYANYTPEE